MYVAGEQAHSVVPTCALLGLANDNSNTTAVNKGKEVIFSMSLNDLPPWAARPIVVGRLRHLLRDEVGYETDATLIFSCD